MNDSTSILDYLFIDEAGQVSVANVIAMGTSARNIVLVGDQMQLGQPIQGVHPGEAGLSILDFLLGNQATVAPDRGIFLNQTRRLHPTVCQFISEAFYEGRLAPDPGNASRRLIFESPIEGITPQGIHFLPVIHAGCSQKSEEEGRTIKEYFEKLVGQTFVDKDGSARVMTEDDILVVSPYNVQVNHLKAVLPPGPESGRSINSRARKHRSFSFQWRPRMPNACLATSSSCLARTASTLLCLCQCLAVVAANPKLLETPCRTIDQLRLVNRFCQLVEFASAAGDEDGKVIELPERGMTDDNKGASRGSA